MADFFKKFLEKSSGQMPLSINSDKKRKDLVQLEAWYYE
jgi:hypothetical protein